MKILLCGYMGAGKSYWLNKMPGNYSQRFDLDQQIEAMYGPIGQIFAHEGEATFRRYESEVLLDVLSRPGPWLIALGGGALNLELRERLRSAGHGLIWLDTPLACCLERIKGSDRPKSAMTFEQHQSLYNLRVPLYRMADWTVQGSENAQIESDQHLFKKMMIIMNGRIDEALRHS